jgi:hypothetical protein
MEADVRSVTRTCRGTPLLPQADQEALAARWRQISAAADFQAGIAFKTAIEDVLGVGNMEIADNDWDALFRRLGETAFAYRNNCGYDFNEIVLSNPLDGKEHSYTCPHCGQTGMYTAPLYE